MWVNDAQPPPPHDLAGVTGEGHGPYLPQVPSCTQRHPPPPPPGVLASQASPCGRTLDRGKALTVRGHVKGGPRSAGQEGMAPPERHLGLPADVQARPLVKGQWGPGPVTLVPLR